MNSKNFKKSIETLAAQNENGQFDQVINELKVQLQNLQKSEEKARKEAELVKRIEEEWGLTKEQYYKVVKFYLSFRSIPDPLAFDLEFNNKQMKLFAHLWIEHQEFNKLRIDSDGTIITNNEAYQIVYSNPEHFINIDKIVDDNFPLLDEEELYRQLVENRDCLYETDADGNIPHEDEEEIYLTDINIF